MQAMRLTRRLNSGMLKIRDRQLVKDGDGKEGYEDVYHVLGVQHSPKQKMDKRMKKVKDKDGKESEVDSGEVIGARDKKTGLPVWESYGESFEVNDKDYVIQHHGGILEPC